MEREGRLDSGGGETVPGAGVAPSTAECVANRAGSTVLEARGLEAKGGVWDT